MKNKDNILLIGMPGSGKSTVGKILAKKTGMKHIDTDALICDAEGMSLHDIIKAKGLEEFKRIEEQTLLDLNVKGCVISTGGSAVYFEKAMEHLKESCTAVYLFTDPDTLLSHIRNLELFSNKAAPQWYLTEYNYIQSASAQDFLEIMEYFPVIPPARLYSVDSKK